MQRSQLPLKNLALLTASIHALASFEALATSQAIWRRFPWGAAEVSGREGAQPCFLCE